MKKLVTIAALMLALTPFAQAENTAVHRGYQAKHSHHVKHHHHRHHHHRHHLHHVR